MPLTTFETHTAQVHEIFCRNFAAALGLVKKSKHKLLTPHTQGIYRRWYYSPLVENTQLTPANLVENIAAGLGLPSGTEIIPITRPPYTKASPVEMAVTYFSANGHPIVADLRALIDHCHPDIELDPDYNLHEKELFGIAQSLSIYDPFYASYLMEVAFHMGLLERMPSLYVHKAQVADAAAGVLAQEDPKLLQDIIEATLELAAIALKTVSLSPVQIFSKEGLFDLLKNPITTEMLIKKAFAAMGYNLDELLLSTVDMELNYMQPEDFDFNSIDFHSDLHSGFHQNMPHGLGHGTNMRDDMSDLDDMEEDHMAEDIVHSIFMLGTVLEKVLLTPLSFYLRMIKPVYSIAFDVESEVGADGLQDDLIGGIDPEEILAFCATPASAFTLTALGRELLDVPPAAEEVERILPDNPAEIEQIFATEDTLRAFLSAAHNAIQAENLPNAIYTFHVEYAGHPNMWSDIEIPKTFNLHHLFVEIVETYGITWSDKYSFYHSPEENPFAEYVGYGASQGKKATAPNVCLKTTFSDLDFQHQKHMVLTLKAPTIFHPIYGAESDGQHIFHIQLVSITPPDMRLPYPRTSQMSQENSSFFEDFSGPGIDWM